MRSQFHHVVDIVPTIYDALGITPPSSSTGRSRSSSTGISLAYTFDNATAPTKKQVQYFDNNGSRAI